MEIWKSRRISMFHKDSRVKWWLQVKMTEKQPVFQQIQLNVHFRWKTDKRERSQSERAADGKLNKQWHQNQLPAVVSLHYCTQLQRRDLHPTLTRPQYYAHASHIAGKTGNFHHVPPFFQRKGSRSGKRMIFRSKRSDQLKLSGIQKRTSS